MITAQFVTEFITYYLCIVESVVPTGNLSILQSLNLSQNQLAQCPVLDNHILLSTLCLAGNGFTDVASLEMAWLPSLEQLGTFIIDELNQSM